MSAEKGEIVGLALLEGYKVRWSRVTVARDIVQNFYDEVADFREVTVDVDEDEHTVEVSGPSRFDLDYLKYIGATTKATRKRSAGGFGEGFKVCALVMLRDFGCKVIAGSGRWEIRPLLRPMKLGRELCYEVRHLDEAEAHPGSFVRLEGADARLCEVFASVKDLFRHPENPRLQSPIHQDPATGAGVFTSLDAHRGDLFYRGQHRGELRFPQGGALTFAFDERIDALEGDRDRRDFSAAGPLVNAVAARLPDEVLDRLIRHLRVYWQRGGRTLAALLTEAKRRGMRLAFPRRWLARAPRGGYFLERRAERLGFHLGVHKLAGVGMPSVVARLGDAEQPRLPTAVEAARAAVARDLYTHLAGAPPLFTRFRVVDFERPGHDFRGRSCVVPAAVLGASFGESAATVLARFACASGKASRRNADRLTALLEGAVHRAGSLRSFAERWALAADDPGRETFDAGAPDDEESTDQSGLRSWVQVTVLAPDGFPPTEAMIERIEAMCKERRSRAAVQRVSVHGPRDALATYCRGVPTVWINGTEIERRTGTRPAFTMRTFAGPEGARALVPSDAVLAATIEAALAAQSKRKGYHHPSLGNRRELGRAALYRWLAVHAPAEHREACVNDAVSAIGHSAGNPLAHLPWEARFLASDLAVRALLADAEVTAEDALAYARDALDDGYDHVARVVAALETRAPGLTAREPNAERALRGILQRLREALKRGDDVRAAVDDALLHAAPARDVSAWMDELPMDADCARVCADRALLRYWEICGSSTPEAALAGARERFDAAAVRALARHDEQDADGEPLRCSDLHGALDALFGARIPTGPSEAARAVKKVWEDARAAGLSEPEAAARCLEAARPFEEK